MYGWNEIWTTSKCWNWIFFASTYLLKTFLCAICNFVPLTTLLLHTYLSWHLNALSLFNWIKNDFALESVLFSLFINIIEYHLQYDGYHFMENVSTLYIVQSTLKLVKWDSSITQPDMDSGIVVKYWTFKYDVDVVDDLTTHNFHKLQYVLCISFECDHHWKEKAKRNRNRREKKNIWLTLFLKWTQICM